MMHACTCMAACMCSALTSTNWRVRRIYNSSKQMQVAGGEQWHQVGQRAQVLRVRVAEQHEVDVAQHVLQWLQELHTVAVVPAAVQQHQQAVHLGTAMERCWQLISTQRETSHAWQRA